MSPLAIDYSSSRPDPQAIVASGYSACLRYLSYTPAKNLSAPEAASLHAVGLGIGLVWETTAARATAGFAAGVSDMQAAIAQALGLGYPAGCWLFLAVDTDVPWATVAPYFDGAASVGGPYVLAPYGSDKIVDGFVAAGLGPGGWQTVAWSGGVLSPNANLYQRLTPTLPPIPDGGYDEDAILKPIVWWGGNLNPQPRQETDVAILILEPGGQPLDLPGNPSVPDSLLVGFDAITPDGPLPTCALRIAAHKADGSDGWIQPPVTVGTTPEPVQYVNGAVSVVKGWPVTITRPAGCDSVSLLNQGTYELTVRV